MVKMNKGDKIQKKAEDAAKETKTESAPKATVKKETKVDKKETAIKTNATLADLEVVLHPLVTEKAVNMIESENKITFIVAKTADKKLVKKVVEAAYSVKVEKVNMVRDTKGRKKAIVKLKKEYKAQDLATKLRVL